MTESSDLWLTVRGDSQRLVPPDAVELHGEVSLARRSKAEALQATASSVDALTTDLTARGGVVAGTATGREPLTWSVHTVTTGPEFGVDPRTGRAEPTGRVLAHAAIRLTVRELGDLDAIGTVLAGHPDLHLAAVSWHVDADNPAWPEVRAAAVQAALRRARDYAAALGATVRAVDHLADVGLLGAPAGQPAAGGPPPLRGGDLAETAAAAGGPAAPSLDPVPQLLVAVVEARLRASGPVLPDTGG